jgi:hypothetical protein
MSKPGSRLPIARQPRPGNFIEALREQDEAQVQELGTQLEETEQQADALAANIGIRACGAD